MDLVHEFTYRATLEPPMAVGSGPAGLRMVVNVTGGTVTGERITGTLVGPGGDWLVIGPDGFARLDVRAQIQTGDGALLYFSLSGLLEANEATMGAAASGGETSFDDAYIRSTPRLETGDDRYAWVNRSIFVARSRIIPDGVEHEVYLVT